MASPHPTLDATPTAKQLGYRMPAEWEPLEGVWVTPPHNPDTWPGCFEAAQKEFADMLNKMGPYVETRSTRQIGIETDDSWVRDYGPIFVTHSDGRIACHDFIFNCWGNKYEPYDKDNAVPKQIAQRLDLPVWSHDWVLEGGSIEVNGRGTVMTTRQCLLHPSRNPHLPQPAIEQRLHDALGTRHTLWLPGGIAGDDTDGHIDDVARFIRPDTIAAVRAPGGHPDHKTLERNWQALQEARDQDGQPFHLVELPAPAPGPIHYDYPPDEYSPGGVRPVPASYANFLIANQAVFVPIFGCGQDDAALRVMEHALPEHTVVGVRCEHLVVGLGAIHCLTMQQPKVMT